MLTREQIERAMLDPESTSEWTNGEWVEFCNMALSALSPAGLPPEPQHYELVMDVNPSSCHLLPAPHGGWIKRADYDTLRALCVAQQRDAERLDWLLKHAYGRTLGAGADDWDYSPINSREQIDAALAGEERK